MTVFRMLFVACSLAVVTTAEANEPARQRLAIGSVAPHLEIEHWLNGEEAATPLRFEPGRVYVVEFWATWCGSCIRRMPRLAEVQSRYADGRVTVVSITDEDRATARAFLARPCQLAKGETPRTYADLTSGYRLAADPDRSCHEAYLTSAESRSLATAFLVGKTGLVEWIGDTDSLDEPLTQVVADSWDRDAFASEFARTQKRWVIYEKLFTKMRSGDLDAVESRLDELASAEDAELASFAEAIRPKVREQWFFMAATNDLEATIDRLPQALRVQTGDTQARDSLNKQVRIAIELGVLEEPDDLRRVAVALEAAAAPNEPDEATRRTIDALHEAADTPTPDDD